MSRPYLTERELAATSLKEEMAEVAIEFSKADRFGWMTVNPFDGTTPHERMEDELGDLLGSIKFFLDTHPEFNQERIARRAAVKRAKVEHWNNQDVWGSTELPPACRTEPA